MQFTWVAVCAMLLAVGADVAGDQAGVGENQPKTSWLSRIDRVTRLGQHIDVSLSKIDEYEDCYFITPGGVKSNKSIEGVTIQKQSNFVSCRITVGPIDRSLVGTWTLCGRYVIHERCQQVNLTWHNNNNPNAVWQVTPHPQFNHSVSLDGYLRPVVIGNGVTRSCHVITPNGEDLIITDDTHYPKIKLIPFAPATMTCSVSIGPIENWMLGEWTLYGMFRRQVNTEVRLPMRMDLYDKDDPFAQPYNVTNLVLINRSVIMGRNITVEVTGRGNVDACEYRTPTGDRYQFNDSFHFPGVTIRDVGHLTICRMVISLTDALMYGKWQVIGKFSSNGVFTEIRQPLIIEMSDKDELESIEWLPNIQIVTRTEQFIDITLNNIAKNEICHFVNPHGDQGSEDTKMTGVTVQASSKYVSCRITVGPMEQLLIGNWTLCGKHGSRNEYKRCQSVNIVWHNNNNPSSTWQVNQQRHFNHSVSIGRYLHPVVNNTGSASTMSCNLITPNGEDLFLTPESFYPGIQLIDITGVTCAVIIGPIERWMLGEWTLSGKFLGRMIVEVRLPMSLELYDEDNPYIQPYNVTNLIPFNRILHLDTSTTVEVTGSGNIDRCQYRAPSGQIFEFRAPKHFPGVTIVNVANTIVCRMSIGPIEKQMLGEWQIIGQFSNNGIFTETRQIFHIIQEDPENPIIEDRPIENLTEREINTDIGASESVTITQVRFVVPETCHIRTPARRQYIMSENFNVTGVTPRTGSNIECGVTIEVLSEDMIGEWTLISRALSSNTPVERRLRFVIRVEEQVEAFPQDLVITKGNDIHVRLRNPTYQYETCKLFDPHNNEVSTPLIDTNHIEACGFIVKDIDSSDQGTWEIVYGRTIVYRAPFNVTVIENDAADVEDIDLVKDTTVDQIIGRKDAVFCRLEDPKGFVVFDGFGQCRLFLDRVTLEHNGLWTMQLGLPGRILVEVYNFVVRVNEAEPNRVVRTTVQRQQPSVILSCSVLGVTSVKACKFRNPMGDILIATQGVGQDRYIADGAEVSYMSNVTKHECILRITNPGVIDLGMWRCSIKTNASTYYGFLSVICPWLMKDPEVEAIVLSEPILTAVRQDINAIEGEGVTMSCSIHSTIRYCYFRSWNGTVFSVTPETSSSSLEYVGDGFHAGDCGVRLKGLVATDSGNWTCHVGLTDVREPEQRASFLITVQEPIVVKHYWHPEHGLVVEARVHSQRMLRYCRFVRSDGLGFTQDNMPAGYSFIGSLENGHCLLQMEEGSIVNFQPWTITVKIVGQGLELSRKTTDNLLSFGQIAYSVPVYIWFIIMIISSTILTLGISLGPKKNRKWTYNRASRIGNSIRDSLRKSKGVRTG